MDVVLAAPPNCGCGFLTGARRGKWPPEKVNRLTNGEFARKRIEQRRGRNLAAPHASQKQGR